MKRRVVGARGWLWLVVALGSAPALRVQAQETLDESTDEARLHFKLGVDFYRERNYRAALIEFQRAYQATPHYKLLYNLGQASLQLREDVAALDYFTRYLQEGQAELSDERRREVFQDLARLRARMATLTITTQPEGAEIFVDGTSVGHTPLAAPVAVGAGRRRISALKQGFSSVERIIDIAASDKPAIVFELQERQLNLTKLLPPVAPAEREHETKLSTAGWMAIATGMVGASAITLTVLTALAQSAYDDEMKGETSLARLNDMREEAKAKALIADVLWGATLATGTLTAILLLTDTQTERAPRAGVALQLGASGVRLDGRF